MRDILNDEHMAKYSHISDIDITNAASLKDCNIPSSIRHLEEMEPDPEPPPSPTPVVVEEVSQLECEYDAIYAVGERFPEFDESQDQEPPQDTSHLLWDTFMFPSSELDDKSISPATILQLLAKHDATTFTTPISHSSIRQQAFRLNVDGGANRSVTNNLDYMHTSWDIDPYRIGGIGDGIVCTKKGIFHLICDDGSVLPVSIFYSNEATETVLSPTDIVFCNADIYDSWWQISDCLQGTGELRFYKTDAITRAAINITMNNKLWYINQDIESTLYRAKIRTASDAFVHSVTGSTLHHLWHHRLCHAGKFVTDNIATVADGVPSLKRRNPFFSCGDCSSGKMTDMIKGYNKQPARATQRGGRFNMDYGFVRGKTTFKNEDGPLLTSKDGFNCYLLAVDEYSRHMWIFLFSNKSPPLSTIKSFLSTHGLKSGLRCVRTDQGGELAGSIAFRKCIALAGYTLETTGAGASFQNAIVERPHRQLANMIRTMLTGANLDSTYWSHAIRHAVYIKNRLPHTALPGHLTPYQMYTGRRPDLTHIRVFGSHVTVKQPRVRHHKIDNTYTTTGVFLGFTSTDRTIWYEDYTTGELKSARHATFDEAHYTPNHRPPYAQELMDIAEEHMSDPTLKRPSPTLPLHLIPTLDHTMTTPPLPDDSAHITPVPTTSPPQNNTLPPNHRSPQSSTTPSHMHVIPDDSDQILTASTTAQPHQPDDFTLSSNPFGNSVEISIPVKGIHPTLGLDLIQDDDTNRIKLKSCSPSTPAARIPRWRSTLRDGIVIAINDAPVDTIDNITTAIATARTSSTPSLRFTFIPVEHVNIRPDTNVPQINFDQMNIMAHQHHAARTDTPPWTDPHNLPPVDDAMVFAAMDRGHIKPRLTRAFLRRQSDWMDWSLSEFKQLNQYHAQDMFGDPIQRPPGCNVLPLIWTYLIKNDGTKKARCVCNGSPTRQGSVTLAHTYAAALDQSGARTFWAITAINDYVAYGADATNAFGEAPPPTAPLYVTIDAPFKAWWEKILKRPPITVGHVLPVRHALQGHPESPRLWATMIDNILTGPTLNFQSTTHEPCLYRGNIDDMSVYLLRQVDDFAVAAPSEAIANKIFTLLQAGLKQPLKLLGLLTMYNGLDIQQSNKFVKVSCKTYIRKILEGHGWEKQTHKSPIVSPMNHEKKYLRELETSAGPTDPTAHAALQKEMGFSYRQSIGELLFAAITCRPDILYCIIKLSQYNTKPARIHYIAVKRVFRYLRDTIEDGLHYWRQTLNPLLPNSPCPSILHDNHDVQIPHSTTTHTVGFVDSDWAGDTSHRRSISGLCLCFAGAPVVYRARFQPTISQSSTEAEFIAAVEAGKLALYLRSMLDDLGITQANATPLYEDNDAAIAMANASRPTRRTRHMDIKHFALMDWVATDQLILMSISTHDNPADGLTKSLGPHLFARHSTTLLGKRKPAYCDF